MRVSWYQRVLNNKVGSYPNPILMTAVLLGSIMIFNAPAQASSKTSSQQPSRLEVSNPNNFKRIHITGKAVTSASIPCPVYNGIIDCALKKLKIINEPALSIQDDYDLVQVFYYPNTEQAKTAVVIAQKSGVMDDSIRAIRYRVSFQLEQGGTPDSTWNWVQYGEQFQCARGEAAGRWVKGRCL